MTVTTRSQTLSSRMTTMTPSPEPETNMRSPSPVRRSLRVVHARGSFQSPPPTLVNTSNVYKYKTGSKRMNTRSSEKLFIKLTEKHYGTRTRSQSQFIQKYSDYTGAVTRSMSKCM